MIIIDEVPIGNMRYLHKYVCKVIIYFGFVLFFRMGFPFHLCFIHKFVHFYISVLGVIIFKKLKTVFVLQLFLILIKTKTTLLGPTMHCIVSLLLFAFISSLNVLKHNNCLIKKYLTILHIS